MQSLAFSPPFPTVIARLFLLRHASPSAEGGRTWHSQPSGDLKRSQLHMTTYASEHAKHIVAGI